MLDKIGYYKHIYFNIIHHENKLGYYKHRYLFFIILYQSNQKQSVYTITLQIAKNTIVLHFG
jgi:hypothetical protein